MKSDHRVPALGCGYKVLARAQAVAYLGWPRERRLKADGTKRADVVGMRRRQEVAHDAETIFPCLDQLLHRPQASGLFLKAGLGSRNVEQRVTVQHDADARRRLRVDSVGGATGRAQTYGPPRRQAVCVR